MILTDFFAAADNLVKRKPAEFIPGLMTERGALPLAFFFLHSLSFTFFPSNDNYCQPRNFFHSFVILCPGKQMDGWETRRHNKDGVDIAIVRLGLRGVVHGVCVDTSHFSGNHAPEITVEVALVPEATNIEILLDDAQTKWTTIVPRSRCRGSFYNYFAATSKEVGTVSHVRLRMYPDGGIARLRVYGEVKPDFAKSDSLDLASVANGGLVVAASDSHFSSKDNIIGLGFGQSMADGSVLIRIKNNFSTFCLHF